MALVLLIWFSILVIIIFYILYYALSWRREGDGF
jgi:hypothetical protein